MALIPQEIRAWSRVRLDRERTDLDPDDLAYAMNVDLFLEPGTIRVRRGRILVVPSALGDAIRLIGKARNTRYAVAGTALFRTGAMILTTLSALKQTAIQPARPLNDSVTYAFIADPSGMYKDDGATLTTWGIAGPAAAPTVGTTGTGLTGSYGAEYTYVRKDGSVVVAESNPSPPSSTQALANQNLTVDVIASTDAQVTNIRIYRTTDTGASYLFDQEVANATATITSSQADNALGSAVTTDNDAPPKCGFISEPIFDRWWLCQDPNFPHYLYYSKRFQPESVPAANYLILGTPDAPLQCAFPFGGIGVVFSTQKKWRIVGTGTTAFVPYESPSKRGTLGPRSAVLGEDGIYFAAHDGIFRTTGFAGDEQLAGPILPLFNGQSRNGYLPINLDVGKLCSIAVWKGRLYFAYADTSSLVPNQLAVHRLGTTQWQFYDWQPTALFKDVETDELLCGEEDGLGYSLEVGSSDAGRSIALTAETKDYAHVTSDSPGGPMARKLYYGSRLDCEPDSGIGEEFLVDDVSKHTETITEDRVPSVHRLPGDAQGYRWRKRWTYTGVGTARIFGTTVLAQPL